MRLNKFIATCGVASRRKCDDLIFEGHVTVNGQSVTHPGTPINEDKDRIEVDGKPVVPLRRNLYIMLHKPRGIVTTTSDERGRKTVMDIVKVRDRIYPVGRLDRDSSGLLILTNDGELSRRLMHPSSKIKKIYHVRLNRRMNVPDMVQFEEGVFVDGKKTASAQIYPVDKLDGEPWYEVVLHEGRNRQIRKMMNVLNYEVKRLKRVQYGPLTLGKLKPGEWRHLNYRELDMLKFERKTKSKRTFNRRRKKHEKN